MNRAIFVMSVLLGLVRGFSDQGDVCLSVVFQEISDDEAKYSKPRFHLENCGDQIDITGFKVKYFFQNDHDMIRERAAYPPGIFYGSTEPSIGLESCGGDNYAVTATFNNSTVLNFLGGNSGDAYFGIWNGDPEWPRWIWNVDNDFSYSPSKGSYMNQYMGVYNAVGSLVSAHTVAVPSWAPNCTPVSSSSTAVSSSSGGGSGNARVEFLMRDQNPQSAQQATVRIKMRNPGTSAYHIPQNAYYRYYFKQPPLDFWYGNEHATNVLPTFVAYWTQHETISMESCGNGYWSIKYVVGGSDLYAGGAYELPSSDGNVIDIYLDHHSWPPYLTKDDDYSWINTSTFQVDPNIAMFDASGNLLFGTPPASGYACPGDNVVHGSSSSAGSSSTPASSSSSSSVCSFWVTGSGGGQTLPSGRTDLVGNPTMVVIDGRPDPGYRFAGWSARSGNSQFADVSMGKTTVIPACGDTVLAGFVPMPANNGSVEDGCGDESVSAGMCSIDQQEVGDMAAPDFKHVWLSNDSAGVHFLVQLCGVVNFDADQYLYFDTQSGGDANGYDVRYKIDYYHPGSVIPMLLAKEVYDPSRHQWMFAQEAVPDVGNPPFALNSSSSQALPDGGTAAAGTLIESYLPVPLLSGMKIRWWIDGSQDHVRSALNPDTFYVSFPLRAVTVDGQTGDWLSSIAASSSSVNASSSSASCAAGDCASNPLTLSPDSSLTLTKTIYVKLSSGWFPATSKWEYSNALLHLQFSSPDASFTVKISVNGGSDYSLSASNYYGSYDSVPGTIPSNNPDGLVLTLTPVLPSSETFTAVNGGFW